MRPVTKYSRIMPSTTLFRTPPIAITWSYDQHYLPSKLRNLSRLSRARIGKLQIPIVPLFLKWNIARLSLWRYTELRSNFWFACPIPSSVVSAIYTALWNDWIQLLLSPIHHSWYNGISTTRYFDRVMQTMISLPTIYKRQYLTRMQI